MMLRYPVKFTTEDDAILVDVPDFPEAHTFGYGEVDARRRAVDAIASAMLGRVTDGEEIPAPSRPKRGQPVVAIPALVWAKLELYRAMLETGTKKADLARRLKVHPPQIDRLLNLDHDSRLDQIENAARALGRELHLEIRPAA